MRGRGAVQAVCCFCLGARVGVLRGGTDPIGYLS
jgi:hypothetical protein